MKFKLVEEFLTEDGDRGLGEVTQVICDLLSLSGCKGISINDAHKYTLHHKNSTHKLHRVYNLLLVPNDDSYHNKAHTTAYHQTDPNKKTNQEKDFSELPKSYSNNAIGKLIEFS
jgi:hypothetical protein